MGDRRARRIELVQQRDLVRFLETRDGIRDRVQRTRAAALSQRRHRRLPLARDRAHGMRRLGERRERDVVRIRVGLLVAADRAHADAAIDVERARLDDALLQAPAFEPRVLEVEIGEFDVVRVDVGQHARQRGLGEAGGCEQQVFGVGQQCGGHRRNGKIGHE